MLAQAYTTPIIDAAHRTDPHQIIAALEDRAHRRNLMAVATGHDLRHSLQTILSAIENVSTIGTSAGATFWRAVAEDQIHRMAADLSNMMLAAYAETRPCRPVTAPFPAADLFDSVEADWQAMAFQKRIDLRFVRSSVQIVGDQTILRSILTNLVGNAVRHTMQGGVVVGCRHLRNGLAIDVADTGCGLDPDFQQCMFEPFTKVRQDNDGFGMGLWIARALSEASGHRLSCRSEPGVGTRFRIDLFDPGLVKPA